MQQHVVDERNGARRAGRWCTRALMVLGGAVAGTAAAWALSTSPASASVENTVDPADPVVQTAAEPAGDLSGHFTGDLAPGAETAPATEDGTADAEHADSADSAGQREDHPARDAIDDARDSIHKPVEGTVRTLAHVLTEPADTPQMMRDALRPPERWQEFGQQVWDYFQPDVPGDLIPQPSLPTGGTQHTEAPSTQPDVAALTPDTQSVQPPPSDAAASHGTSTDVAGTWSAWSSGDDLSDTTVDHGRSDVPAAPLQLPIVPLSTPHAPGTGGGGHVDALQLGVPNAGPAAVDPSVAAAVRYGVQHLLLRPQPQPGVSPD